MLFIVSEVELDGRADDGDELVDRRSRRRRGVKCERCWRFVPVVSTEPDWAGICDRCVDALRPEAVRS